MKREFERRWLHFWHDWIVARTYYGTLVAGGLVYTGDALFDLVKTAHVYAVIFDWTAHINTALLALNLLPERWRRPILPQALLASFLIDLDHVPQYLGSNFLVNGAPRPYTHSLSSPALCLILAAAGWRWRRWRLLWVGIAVGLCLHFFRDLAEEPGNGMALFWPLGRHDFHRLDYYVYTSYHYSHTLFLAFIAILIVANLIRLAIVGEDRTSVPGAAASAA